MADETSLKIRTRDCNLCGFWPLPSTGWISFSVSDIEQSEWLNYWLTDDRLIGGLIFHRLVAPFDAIYRTTPIPGWQAAERIVGSQEPGADRFFAIVNAYDVKTGHSFLPHCDEPFGIMYNGIERRIEVFHSGLPPTLLPEGEFDRDRLALILSFCNGMDDRALEMVRTILNVIGTYYLPIREALKQLFFTSDSLRKTTLGHWFPHYFDEGSHEQRLWIAQLEQHVTTAGVNGVLDLREGHVRPLDLARWYVDTGDEPTAEDLKYAAFRALRRIVAELRTADGKTSESTSASAAVPRDETTGDREEAQRPGGDDAVKAIAISATTVDWTTIKMRFSRDSPDVVLVTRDGGQQERLTAAQLGLADKRNGWKPNAQWNLLKRFANEPNRHIVPSTTTVTAFKRSLTRLNDALKTTFSACNAPIISIAKMESRTRGGKHKPARGWHCQINIG